MATSASENVSKALDRFNAIALALVKAGADPHVGAQQH